MALPTAADAEGLAWLLPRTELPLMADIHFDPALALAAMDAGCRSIRINPGNMPLGRLNEMIREAKNLALRLLRRPSASQNEIKGVYM